MHERPGYFFTIGNATSPITTLHLGKKPVQIGVGSRIQGHFKQRQEYILQNLTKVVQQFLGAVDVTEGGKLKVITPCKLFKR